MYIEYSSLWSCELFILYLPCYCGSYLQAAAWHCMHTHPGIHRCTDQIIAGLDQLLLLRTFPSSFTSVVCFKQAPQFTETLLRNKILGSNTAFSAKACLEIQSAFRQHFQCGCANILSTPPTWHVEKLCETEKAKTSFREKNQKKIKKTPKAWE